MRILHIAPTYLPATRYGGPIYSVHALAKAQSARGHDVQVYTTNVDGPDVSPVPVGQAVRLDDVAVTYFATALGRRLFRSPEMAAALAANVAGFDVMHTHSIFLWPMSAAAAAARRHAVPYVMAPRGMLVADLIQRKSRLAKTAWIRLFEQRNLAGAAAIHVTSQLEAEDLYALHLKMGRIVVIPNGIELPPEAPATSRWSALPRPLVVSLGRISWKKGLDRLIPAMAHVPQAHLVLAGNDEEGAQPALEDLARKHGVVDRVQFVGPVYGADKWSLLRAADIFALPSYNENFGNAVLEAMACGVPVVVTPEVGLAAAVQTAGAGVVTSGEPGVLGPALAQLLADAETRARMGAAGRRSAREDFSWAAIARQTEDLYRGIVGSAKHSPRQRG